MAGADRKWWPEDYDLPAFRVQRQAYGLGVGGDYVRGSGVETLEHTALRYPTHSLDLTAIEMANRGAIFAKAFNYSTIEIQWSWPSALYDTFVEVAMVRSSYGAPSSPMQGQTVYRALRADLTEGQDEQILNDPPIIYDVFVPTEIPDLNHPGAFLPGLLPNGRWYYYTVFFRTNAYDWTPLMSDSCLLPRYYGHDVHLWDSIPPYYQYTDDNYRGGGIGFLRQFLTVFGFEMDRTREYVEALMKLHWIDQSPMALLKQLGANYGQPYEQGIGDVRYRALLANLSYLLSVRGTAKGLLELTETVSKYDSDLTYGANTVLLPDDSNFVNGAGHWAPIHPNVPFSSPLKADYLTYDQVKLTAPTVFPTASPPEPVTGSTSCLLVDTADTNTKDMWIALGCGLRSVPIIVPSPDSIRTNWGSWYAMANTLPGKFAYIQSRWGSWTTTAIESGLKETIPYYTGLPVNEGEVYGFSAWVKCMKAVTVSATLLVSDANGQPTDLIMAHNYLKTSVGTASTPTFTGTEINGNTTWVIKLRKSSVSSTGTLASKLLITSVHAWEIFSDASLGLCMKLGATGTGATNSTYAFADLAAWKALPVGTDFYLALWMNVNNGAGYQYKGSKWSLDGQTWSQLAPDIEGVGSYTGVYNTANIVIGNSTLGGSVFQGDIFSAEQRTGLDPNAGSIVWRFNADEYTTGTTFVDARGKTWTLTAGTAITVMKSPILPASTPLAVTDNGANWHEVSHTGQMPFGAGYLVPSLYFDARTTGGVAGRSPAIYVAAVMVYRIQSSGVVATFAPNRYLTLGVSSEMLGPTRTTPPYEGFYIGSPR